MSTRGAAPDVTDGSTHVQNVTPAHFTLEQRYQGDVRSPWERDLTVRTGIVGIAPGAYDPAPHSEVPDNIITCIEHPCIIRNVDKGIKSLGGQPLIEKFLKFEQQKDDSVDTNPKLRMQLKMDATKQRKTIGVRLRPDDPTAKPIASFQAKSNNVLLKVTVPRRTGRRRKKGSSEPFVFPDGFVRQDDEALHADPRRVVRSLRDNPDQYKFEALGVVTESHRFRVLPDAQYAVTTDPFADSIRDKILTMSYHKIMRQRFTDTRCKPGPTGPAAEFYRLKLPMNYGYLQNPLTYFTKDENGVERAVNSNKFNKPNIQTILAATLPVPSGPAADLPPETHQTPAVRKLIKELRQFMENRPVCSTRVLGIDISSAKQNKFYVALAYVGYAFKAGPWKRCIVKFGHDPRTHPSYRKFQTITFQLDRGLWDPTLFDVSPTALARNPPGSNNRPKPQKPIYTFDGFHFTPEHCVWQIVDISDPQLRPILDKAPIKQNCAIHSTGWFYSGTMAKLKVVLRDKMHTILAGDEPDVTHYERVLKFPDILTKENLASATLRHSEPTEREHLMERAYRGLATPSVDKYTERLARNTAQRQSVPASEAAAGNDAMIIDSGDEDEEGLELDADEVEGSIKLKQEFDSGEEDGEGSDPEPDEPDEDDDDEDEDEADEDEDD